MIEVSVWSGPCAAMVVIFICFDTWANPRGNAIRGRPVGGVEQAHSTRPVKKNTGNFIGLSLETVAEITLQRTDTTHDLSSESREAISVAATPTCCMLSSYARKMIADLHTRRQSSQPARIQCKFTL